MNKIRLTTVAYAMAILCAAVSAQAQTFTLIKAEVPSGATTGTIQVTTPTGTLSSNVAFQVLQ